MKVQQNVSVSADSQHQVHGLTREECCKTLCMTGTATSEVSKNSWKTSLTVRDLQLETVPEVKVLMHAEPQLTISEAANEVILYVSAQAIMIEELQVRQLCSAITDRQSKALLKDKELVEKSVKDVSFLGKVVTGGANWAFTYKSETKQVIGMAHHIISMAKPVLDCVLELEIHMVHIFQ